MKAIQLTLASFMAVAVLGAFSIGTAEKANAWYCSARGTTGASGWGRSSLLSSARIIALRECAVSTPQGARCYIMYCN
jgi:hypothetical protein